MFEKCFLATSRFNLSETLWRRPEKILSAASAPERSTPRSVTHERLDLNWKLETIVCRRERERGREGGRKSARGRERGVDLIGLSKLCPRAPSPFNSNQRHSVRSSFTVEKHFNVFLVIICYKPWRFPLIIHVSHDLWFMKAAWFSYKRLDSGFMQHNNL